MMPDILDIIIVALVSALVFYIAEKRRDKRREK